MAGLDHRDCLGGVSDLKLGVDWTRTEAQVVADREEAGGFGYALLKVVWVMGC